jgi:Mg-chelatase subunit ChlD
MPEMPEITAETERLRRWRLILGETGVNAPERLADETDRAIDRALDSLYGGDRKGTLRRSTPRLIDWLGDIRRYFPTEVVHLLQRDAIERLDLRRLLLEPESLEAVAAAESDPSLLPTILTLAASMPEETRRTAREVVQRLVAELTGNLEPRLRRALGSGASRSRQLRPQRASDFDWPRTIRANLAHYQPDFRTVIPVNRVARPRASLRQTVILCIDQSASMAGSAVHAAILGSVLASIPSLRTHLLVFDTAVVDLTAHLADPVELLFSLNLGGGTDIRAALQYAQGLVDQPEKTVLFLISDLHDGGRREDLIQTFVNLRKSGLEVVSLLALDDRPTPTSNKPAWNQEVADELAALGLPALATTPERFPDLLAAILDHRTQY